MIGPGSLKKHANKLKRQTGVSHTLSLNTVAQKHGFESYQTYLEAWQRNKTEERMGMEESVFGHVLGDSD